MHPKARNGENEQGWFAESGLEASKHAATLDKIPWLAKVRLLYKMYFWNGHTMKHNRKGLLKTE